MKGHVFRADDAGPDDLDPRGFIDGVLDDIRAERARQKAIKTDATDPVNTHNDWIAFASAYLGRAASGVYRNQREKCDYRENMIKAASVIVAAIEAHDASLETVDGPDFS